MKTAEYIYVSKDLKIIAKKSETQFTKEDETKTKEILKIKGGAFFLKKEGKLHIFDPHDFEKPCTIISNNNNPCFVSFQNGNLELSFETNDCNGVKI